MSLDYILDIHIDLTGSHPQNVVNSLPHGFLNRNANPDEIDVWLRNQIKINGNNVVAHDQRNTMNWYGAANQMGPLADVHRESRHTLHAQRGLFDNSPQHPAGDSYRTEVFCRRVGGRKLLRLYQLRASL